LILWPCVADIVGGCVDIADLLREKQN